MPRRAPSAAKMVLLYVDELKLHIFNQVKGFNTLLNLRLVCKDWAYKILLLKKKKYIRYYRHSKKSYLICDSGAPYIKILRRVWELPENERFAGFTRQPKFLRLYNARIVKGVKRRKAKKLPIFGRKLLVAPQASKK
jgi:hypothetical protein